ncbi:MAG: hypothetical protein AcusKO_30080 [Acuticoccus sp.]
MIRPDEVLLHIGHGKTGSSYLQALLASSVEILAAHGIAYPIDAEIAHKARSGAITSGNLPAGPGHFSRLLRTGWEGPTQRLLISGEAYFARLDANGVLVRIREQVPDATVRVLLYVRDPLDHAASFYQQSIKRGGYTESFSAFLDTYNVPRRVAQMIAFVEGEGGSIAVRNYSRFRDDLKGSLEAWLGLPHGVLREPQSTSVNRSMTRAELAFQAAFNRHYGPRSARFVSDPLCETLPDVRSENPVATRQALERFLARMQEMLAEVSFGARAPEGEGYRLPSLDEAIARFEAPQEAPVYTFTAVQLETLAEAISAVVPPDTEHEEAAAQRRERRARKMERTARR